MDAYLKWSRAMIIIKNKINRDVSLVFVSLVLKEKKNPNKILAVNKMKQERPLCMLTDWQRKWEFKILVNSEFHWIPKIKQIAHTYQLHTCTVI